MAEVSSTIREKDAETVRAVASAFDYK